MTSAVVQWLLDGDPSVVWQAQRDLEGYPESEWGPIRETVESHGWGRRLLDNQDPDGKWAGGLYSPKWTSTTYTLLLLRRLGLPSSNAAAIAGARHLLDDARWVDGGVSYWVSHSYAERCVNGMVLSLVAYFDVDDRRADSIAESLLAGRVADGGWNCDDYRGHTGHSSFHTTVSVLEGLHLWRSRTGSTDADAAIADAQEVLLEHRLFRSHTTGDVIDERWTHFSFPPRWHYDVLRGLDHLRESGAAPDPRAEDAVGVVVDRRDSSGRWAVGPKWSGKQFFTLESSRYPGRLNTLRAMRVLDWFGA